MIGMVVYNDQLPPDVEPSTVSKVIERLVLNMLKPHLHSSSSFCRLQSAYRSGLRVTALLGYIGLIRYIGLRYDTIR